MKKIIYFIGVFIFIFTNSFSIEMSSTTFDKRIDFGDGGYKEIVFKNKHLSNVRYKIKILDVSKNGSKRKDMSKWVTVSPKVINIPPMQERTLKIFAKSPNNTEKGEYIFGLKVEPIVIPTIRKAENDKIVGNSIVTINPLVEMIGYVGDPNFKENIVFEDIKVEKVKDSYKLSGTIFNKTYAGKHIGFNFIGVNNTLVDGKYLGRLPANSNHKISVDVKHNFKEISIYDGDTLEEIKRIKLPKI